jgi:hypothetical protein
MCDNVWMAVTDWCQEDVRGNVRCRTVRDFWNRLVQILHRSYIFKGTGIFRACWVDEWVWSSFPTYYTTFTYSTYDIDFYGGQNQGLSTTTIDHTYHALLWIINLYSVVSNNACNFPLDDAVVSWYLTYCFSARRWTRLPARWWHESSKGIHYWHIRAC